MGRKREQSRVVARRPSTWGNADPKRVGVVYKNRRDGQAQRRCGPGVDPLTRHFVRFSADRCEVVGKRGQWVLGLERRLSCERVVKPIIVACHRHERTTEEVSVMLYQIEHLRHRRTAALGLSLITSVGVLIAYLVAAL